MREASAWQRIIGFLLVSSEETSMWCHWQPRWLADKKALRCGAWSPEGTVWSGIHSCLCSSEGWTPRTEGPGLGEKTRRCVCMTRPSCGEIGALGNISFSLWWTEDSLRSSWMAQSHPWVMGYKTFSPNRSSREPYCLQCPSVTLHVMLRPHGIDWFLICKSMQFQAKC